MWVYNDRQVHTYQLLHELSEEFHKIKSSIANKSQSKTPNHVRTLSWKKIKIVFTQQAKIPTECI